LTWGRGKVIAFYSGKGGVGKSLIASTLAQTLQLDTHYSVLLVDLNVQYGGLETYLHMEGQRHLYDLTPVLHELNDNHIRNVTVVEPHSQLEILLSPMNAEIGEKITEEHVERLLRAARLYYDYVLIDLPTEMTVLTYTALEEADHIYYVLYPDIPSLAVFGRVTRLFSQLGMDPMDRLQFLFNRTNPYSLIQPKEIYSRFQIPVADQFRDDAKRIQLTLNQGKLLRHVRWERNLSVFAKDIQRFARALISMGEKDV
jgi:pilus assembly protein CpaE